MGNWNITIIGVGAHHNENYPNNANQLAADFARQLQAAGHYVESVTFTYGGKDDLTPPLPSAYAKGGHAGGAND